MVDKYDQCPMGRGKFDLSKGKATEKMKEWLGRRMAFHPDHVHYLSENYNLSGRTLFNYAAAVKANISLNKKPGRPRIFETDDKESYASFLSDGPYAKSNAESKEYLQSLYENRQQSRGKDVISRK